jgi:P27 family predicted phage terminase small subunit
MSTVIKLAVDNPPPAKAPTAPAGLGKVGKDEWNRVAPLLMRDGSIPAETESLLLLYCHAIEGAQDAAKILRKQGRSLKAPNGLVKQHPMVRAEVTYQQNAMRIAEKLGLTATAKARKQSVGGPTSSLDY